ncbi:mediator of RNA polymerase II transcription subunit 14-like [Dorcoceras hygrometricum]|uniref:Mediator of RNA polymerase II transcription subunit 14-like n=1 Tax=Dorcoceras hygrometricum TaxID=472368 RepID=A0A2Z7BJK2_9LAMI|nr:mediator of RNA polymerase II transcription subunit 14-like [Dorcoceras hygrometricum]
MTFRVVMTNQYNQDLGLFHSTNGNHLESPNEGSSIDYQVTIHLHAQNITMFPTNETWSRLKNQLVKDKPAGHNLQEPIVKEVLSSEDDEDQLERRSADKSKLEKLLKSGCKQEEKERALNRKVPLVDESSSLAPGEPISSTNTHQPQLCVTHLFYAYVRKATDTEFNVFVLGRDLIMVCDSLAKKLRTSLKIYE